MNLLVNSIPLLAVAISQVEIKPEGLTVYGPIGIICLWLMWREERSRADNAKVHEGARQDNAQLRDEIRGVAHQMKGLNRNLLYVTATHGPAGLRDVAERELERINKDEPK